MRPDMLPSLSIFPCRNNCEMRESMSDLSYISSAYVLTFSLANIAPKWYAGGAVCEPKVNECVTLNAGFIDNDLDRSALAPSNK